MAFRTILIENPCRLTYKSGYLIVRKEDETAKVHLSEVSTIILQTRQIFISAYLMAELAKAKISLVISDEKNNPVGQYLPIYGAHNTSKRIREQLDWGEPIKKRVWQRVVRDKIREQSRLLNQRGCEREAKILKNVVADVRSGDTTHREAQAARLYFQTLFGKEYTRDQASSTNAALDYGYAILLSMVNREIVSRGFLTQQGICHRNEYNQFNLSCDLMEPFRPAIDRLVFDFCPAVFDKDMKHTLADLGNKSVRYKDGLFRLSSVVSYYVQDCLNALNKKIAVDDIEKFELL